MVSFFVTVVIFHDANFSIKPLCFTTTEPVGRVILTASSRDLVEFSSVRLSCSVSSGSSVSFLWLNSSSEVTASDRVHLDACHIPSISMQLTIHHSESSVILFLCFNQLSVGPENTLLTKSPSQENYLEGSNITLSCSAVSNPAALFYWLLNGSLLSDTGPEFRLINVQMSQSGDYSCQAFNNQTMIIQTSQPSFISVLSKFEEKDSDVECQAHTCPPPLLHIRASPTSDRVQLTDGNANLTIVNVTRYDRGPYKCDAFNALSNGSKNTLLTKSPSQENYLEGSNIRLSCSAVSNPAALFYWLLNGSLLSDTGPEFRLINVQMSQSGNYSCQAFNNQTMIIQTSQPSFISVLSKFEEKDSDVECVRWSLKYICHL
uniref:Ig-like domain-containing protein n=1 Tax=Echeneis naucrates TaxID=173247 RepID=A0A665WE44_ECHNA